MTPALRLRERLGAVVGWTEAPEVRAEDHEVDLLAEAVSENRRQDLLLTALVGRIEQSLVPVLEHALATAPPTPAEDDA